MRIPLKRMSERPATARPKRTAAMIAIVMLAAAGCATAPPEEWVCDAEGPCYRVAAAPYRPYYATGYGWFGFSGWYWSRPYAGYRNSAAPSSPPPDAQRGIRTPSTRGTTPGRVQPFRGKSRSSR